MNRLSVSLIILLFSAPSLTRQEMPTGNPKDFKLKTCLHSVSYTGVWREQAVCQGYIAYEMCEVPEGGGSFENLDMTARAFLEYVKQFK